MRPATVDLPAFTRKIASDLRRAHDNKDIAAVAPIFREADKALAESGISQTARRSLWATVRACFEAPGLLVEKQANSALIALMQAIQRELAARENK